MNSTRGNAGPGTMSGQSLIQDPAMLNRVNALLGTSIKPAESGNGLQVTVGTATILIALVGAFVIAGTVTKTLAAYAGFVAASLVAYRFRDKIGMTNNLYRTFAVFGGLALLAGSIGDTSSLSIPGLVFVCIGAIGIKIQSDREFEAETKKLRGQIDQLTYQLSRTGSEHGQPTRRSSLDTPIDPIIVPSH